MRGVLAVCLLALLSACASGRHEDGNMQALAPGITLRLPDAPSFGATANIVQLVQARYGNQRQTFQSAIESGAGQFTVLMTVPSGPRIIRIDWRDGSVTAKKETIAPANLSPERILADLMLVYAPSDILRAALVGGTLNVAEAGRTRKILKDGHEVISVTRPAGDIWSGHATLTNLAYDYALDIQSQRAGP
jgi:hypothetical protein